MIGKQTLFIYIGRPKHKRKLNNILKYCEEGRNIISPWEELCNLYMHKSRYKNKNQLQKKNCNPKYEYVVYKKFMEKYNNKLC